MDAGPEVSLGLNCRKDGWQRSWGTEAAELLPVRQRFPKYNVRMRQRTSSLLCLCLLAHFPDLGLAGRVLAVITPGCQSHLLGQRKLIAELARRGHNTMVSAECSLSLQLK